MSKKLYRSEKGKVLVGVCSGLAEHFDIDAVLIRLIFILLSFMSGLGIIIYLVLWLVLPRGIKVASEDAEVWQDAQETTAPGEDIEKDLEAKHQEEESREIIILDKRSPFFVYLVLGLLIVLAGMVFLLENVDRLLFSGVLLPPIWYVGRAIWPTILVIAGLVIVVAGATRK